MICQVIAVWTMFYGHNQLLSGNTAEMFVKINASRVHLFLLANHVWLFSFH